MVPALGSRYLLAMVQPPVLVRIYAFLSVPVIVYLSAIDARGALSLFVAEVAVLLAVSSGLLKRSRVAWLVSVVFALLALWVSVLVLDRYNSPPSIPGTVTVWDFSNTMMAAFAILGLVVLMWPSTLRWFWHSSRDLKLEGPLRRAH